MTDIACRYVNCVSLTRCATVKTPNICDGRIGRVQRQRNMFADCCQLRVV
jgi:hypothetical protein